MESCKELSITPHLFRCNPQPVTFAPIKPFTLAHSLANLADAARELFLRERTR